MSASNQIYKTINQNKISLVKNTYFAHMVSVGVGVLCTLGKVFVVDKLNLNEINDSEKSLFFFFFFWSGKSKNDFLIVPTIYGYKLSNIFFKYTRIRDFF